jgi:hypothetical protein
LNQFVLRFAKEQTLVFYSGHANEKVIFCFFYEGQCYNRCFGRFSPIFGKEISVFLYEQSYDNFILPK